jgi:predicted XRE-type DNA-binding protein
MAAEKSDYDEACPILDRRYQSVVVAFKAELVLRLDKAIRALGLTQRAAARRIGTTQPELSKILGGKFTEVSLERLMRFLTALGYRIEITIATGKARKAGEVTVKDARRSAA